MRRSTKTELRETELKYLVTGAAFIDNIVYADGSRVDKIMGGCGIYAYSGIRIYEDDCAVMLGIGNDFEELYGQWFNDNAISRDGLFVRDEHTAQTVLTYEESGHYTSANIYSGKPGYHNPALALIMDDLRPLLPGLKGIYLQSDLYGNFGEAYRLKDEYGYKIMWEIPAWLGYDFLPTLEETVSHCDIWSLNRKDSFDIFEVDSEEKAIERIRELGVPCFYRVGEKGSYMVTKDGYWFAPVVKFTDENGDPDATGCGNTSTAAALWAWCEEYDPLMTCCLANVAAGYTARQHGPYPVLDLETRKSAMKYAEEICSTLRLIHN